MGYILKKQDSVGEVITYPSNLEGYKLKVKGKRFGEFEVDSINIIDKGLSSKIILNKLQKEIDKIEFCLNYIIENEDDEDGTRNENIVLNEIYRHKVVLANKYKNYLEKKELEEHLSKLNEIENKLRWNHQIYREESTRARGGK